MDYFSVAGTCVRYLYWTYDSQPFPAQVQLYFRNHHGKCKAAIHICYQNDTISEMGYCTVVLLYLISNCADCFGERNQSRRMDCAFSHCRFLDFCGDNRVALGKEGAVRQLSCG